MWFPVLAYCNSTRTSSPLVRVRVCKLIIRAPPGTSTSTSSLFVLLSNSAGVCPGFVQVCPHLSRLVMALACPPPPPRPRPDTSTFRGIPSTRTYRRHYVISRSDDSTVRVQYRTVARLPSCQLDFTSTVRYGTNSKSLRVPVRTVASRSTVLVLVVVCLLPFCHFL